MGILIPIIAMCIPLAAIILSYYHKIEKLRMEGGDITGAKQAMLERKIQMLTQEKEMLEKRLDNLEIIITSSDFLQLPPPIDHQAQAQTRAKELAEQLHKKASS